jgi:AcrR family transcriptional regulator
MNAVDAKGRGRYDRGLSPSERARRHRELIRDATLALLAAAQVGPPVVNIDELCAAVGIGRNTVYGLFESTTALARTCLEEALVSFTARVDGAQDAVNTPLEDVRAFALRWVLAGDAAPGETCVLVRYRRAELLALAESRLATLLSLGAQAGTFARDFGAVRLPLLGEACIGALDRARLVGVEPLTVGGTLAELIIRVAR